MHLMYRRFQLRSSFSTHQAAPTTDREMAKPMPRLAHMKGEVSNRNLQVKTNISLMLRGDAHTHTAGFYDNNHDSIFILDVKLDYNWLRAKHKATLKLGSYDQLDQMNVTCCKNT